MARRNIACIGECMVELISARGDSQLLERRYGGDTLNTCVYLARLLKSSAQLHYITRLGDDRFSRWMIEAWQGEGIDCSMVEQAHGRLPGLYIVDTDAAGERSFFYWRSEAPVRELFRSTGKEVAARLAKFHVLYLTGITLAVLSHEGRTRTIDLMESCRAGGGLVAYDTNHRARLWNEPADAVLWNSRAIAASTLVLPSSDDLKRLFGEDLSSERWLDRLSHLGAREAVLKTGGESAWILNGETRNTLPLEKLAAPFDTTGAGDSFNAGYLAARLSGAKPENAVALGHRLASIVVMHPGAIIPIDAMREFNPTMASSKA
jgi:2-dehydro-3-deoxygluconokinase